MSVRKYQEVQDQQPDPAIFVAANDNDDMTWKGVARLAICTILCLAGWFAFGAAFAYFFL